MSRTNRDFRSLLSPAGRFFGRAVDSLRFAREADRLAQTPVHVFEARGTTRETALRDLVKNL